VYKQAGTAAERIVRVSKPFTSARRLTVPAPVSSLIPAALAPDSVGGSASESDLVALWDVVSTVPDPRSPQGIRYPLATILALSLAATVAGAGTFAQFAAWSADLPWYRRDWFGVGRETPSADTFARVLGLIDADVVDALLSAWVAAHTSGPAAVALDGKALRGAVSADGDMMHLVSMVDHASGVPLGQVDACRGKGFEIPAFRTVLDRIGLRGVVVTADALHTQDAHAHYLHRHGAYYAFTVKANRPKLLAQLRGLPWAQVPVGATTTIKAHGRITTRTIKVVSTSRPIRFPHARLAARIERRVTRVTTGTTSTEVAYVVTSLTDHDVTPARLADLVQQHWSIENRVHWVRDTEPPTGRITPRFALAPDPGSWPRYGTPRSA
jgi:predicted transposase YbfD/YdcC